MNSNTLTSNPAGKSKTIVWVIVGILVIAIAALGAYQFYLYENPLARSDFSFQLYKPTQSLSNLKIANETIDVTMPTYHGIKLFWLTPQHVAYSIGMMPTVQGITESKDQPVADISCGVQTMGNTCALYKTPNGQQYEYDAMHNTVPGQTNNWGGESVRFMKSGTLISVELPVSNNSLTPESELNSFVDSFMPVSANRIKVVHSYPSLAP